MSFLFYNNDPIRESDRSILNNSVVDDNQSDSDSENDYYYFNPYLSGYPGYFYGGYPPYFYHPQSSSSQVSSSSPASTPKGNEPVAAGKPSNVSRPLRRATSHRQASTHPQNHSMDKDVYKLVDFRPNNDLFEDEQNYYIQLDLPGVSKEQIHMEVSEGRILTISGKRENKYKKGNGMKISKMDCPSGKFSRSFNIHETANLDKIEAKMENGVLQVVIPKAEPPKTQRRTIQVQ